MNKVYIGVGHGGKDSGAVGYLVEKDINLKMALACRDYLVKHGVLCKMSRETDKPVSINSKTKEANEWGADLALDIHNNAGGGDGAEVFHSINYGTGKTLADNIINEVKKIGQNSRGTKTKKGANGDYFGFIRNTTMPAVITEMVFVDNKSDAAQADTDVECNRFGEAIAKGVLATLGIDVAETDNMKSENTTFRVRVTTSALNVRYAPSVNSKCTFVIRNKGVYTIVDTVNTNGRVWGKLKSGIGWIALEYTQKI